MSGRPEPLRLLIFDLDGVLADSGPAHARAYTELWREVGVEGPGYEALAGRPTREVVKEVTAALRPDAAQLAAWTRFKQERARAHLADAAVVFEDAAPLVRAMQRAGLRVALATGASERTAALLLARLGLEDAFEVVVSGEQVERGKPHPETFSRALAATGVSAAESLVVEDSAAGLEAALAAGAWAVCVRSGLRHASPRFLGSYPDLAALGRALGVAAASDPAEGSRSADA